MFIHIYILSRPQYMNIIHDIWIISNLSKLMSIFCDISLNIYSYFEGYNFSFYWYFITCTNDKGCLGTTTKFCQWKRTKYNKGTLILNQTKFWGTQIFAEYVRCNELHLDLLTLLSLALSGLYIIICFHFQVLAKPRSPKNNITNLERKHVPHNSFTIFSSNFID